MDAKLFEKWISSLTTIERVDKAKEKLDRLVDDLLNLLQIHTNNEVVTYSPKLASQIPTSRAALAFNAIQYALHRFELIRVCAVWDSADPYKDNLATIVGLVDDPAVTKIVSDETASHWANLEGAMFSPSDDPDLRKIAEQALQDHNTAFGQKMADRDKAWLTEGITEAKTVLTSDKLHSTMNVRDKRLAHSLSITNREKKGPVQPMKFGYEKDLLEAAIRITQKLYIPVTGKGFTFDDSWRIAREASGELWDACKFDFGSATNA